MGKVGEGVNVNYQILASFVDNFGKKFFFFNLKLSYSLINLLTATLLRL